MTLNDGIKQFQKPIDTLVAKVEDPVICEKLKAFVNSDDSLKTIIREEAQEEDIDIVVAILRSELLTPEMKPSQIEKIFNSYVAWNAAVENVRIYSLLKNTN